MGLLDWDSPTPTSYALPDLPWSLAGQLEQVAVAVMGFDAKLTAAGLGAGWQSRCDMTEATRALILDGHFVDIGDVVLHDAGMDVEARPTNSHERLPPCRPAAPSWRDRRPGPCPSMTALRGIAATEVPTPAKSCPHTAAGRKPTGTMTPIPGKAISPTSTLSWPGPIRFWRERCPAGQAIPPRLRSGGRRGAQRGPVARRGQPNSNLARHRCGGDCLGCLDGL